MLKDPATVSWLEKNCDPIFGYPSLVRFSWATTTKHLEQRAVKVSWFILLIFFFIDFILLILFILFYLFLNLLSIHLIRDEDDELLDETGHYFRDINVRSVKEL